jgi:hypothetical protein
MGKSTQFIFLIYKFVWKEYSKNPHKKNAKVTMFKILQLLYPIVEDKKSCLFLLSSEGI